MSISHQNARSLDRRTFLAVSGSCAAHMLLVSAGAPPTARQFLGRTDSRRFIAREPWGRLEEVADGVWALISTPLDGDRTTLCNGGIIRGRDGALVVESFATPAGAFWMAERTGELAGTWPSHVVLTHYHGDHTGGLEGYARGQRRPVVKATETTLGLTRESDSNGVSQPSAQRIAMLADVSILSVDAPTSIDLGGRVVRLVPRNGHTPSDVTVELEDPSVVFCGDLVWNGMFPNYRDTKPSQFVDAVRCLRRDESTVYVPGHGPLAERADLDRYVQLIEHVGSAAQRAIDTGIPVTEAAERYEIPASLGEWHMFRPQYYEVAFRAWERELTGG